MILINLLPPSERKIKWPIKRILIIGISMLFSLFIMVYAQGMYVIATYESQLQELRTQYELLRPVQETMLRGARSEQLITAKNTLLLNLTKQRQPWYAVIAQLGAVMPKEIWLTEINTFDVKSMRLKGMAKSYPDLAAFMKRIESTSIIGEPVVIKTEQDSALPVTNFEIIVKVKEL